MARCVDVFGILFLFTVAVDSQSVSVLPDTLWVSNGGVHNVVEGHVIQVYCSATGFTAPTITWRKDGTDVSQDPPHIFIRTSVSGLTSVLTIDHFNTSDNGAYLCSANGVSWSATSGALTLTTLSSSTSTSLVIDRQPADNERNTNNALTSSDVISNNRTGVRITDVDSIGINGANRLMRCSASHIGGPRAVSDPPSIVWTRNGEEVVNDGSHIVITSISFSDQLQSNLQINGFGDSDTGIYHCIFTDSDRDGELATSFPHRLDHGDVLFLRSITQELVIIDPPEKLVLEVDSAGAYQRFNWERNGVGFNPNPSAVFPAIPERFLYFTEAYVREPTDEVDLGLYEVFLFQASGLSQNTVNAPGQRFMVVPYVRPNTSLADGQSSMETLMEGDDVIFTCTSVGNPAPTFTWRLDGVTLPSNRHTDSSTAPTIHYPFSRTNGTTTSVLTINGAVYPDDDGVYECIGTNSHAGIASSSSASITVTVQALPEVSVVQLAPVVLGTSVTLMCSASGDSPISYTWEQVGQEGVVLSTDESFTLVVVEVSQYGMYRCTATNILGRDSSTVDVIQATTPFQLQITGISDCQGWVLNATKIKLDDIRAEVCRQVSTLCQCEFAVQHISSGEFRCFTDSEEVTYRAEIYGTTSTTSSEVLVYLEEWIHSREATIVVESVRLELDSSCLPVGIGSLTDPECGSGGSEPDDNGSDSTTLPALIGGVVTVVVLATTAVVIAIACLLARNRRQSAAFSVHGKGGGKGDAIKMTESAAYGMAKPPQLPPCSEIPRDYEPITTRNPAYGPATTHHQPQNGSCESEEGSYEDVNVYDIIPGELQ